MNVTCTHYLKTEEGKSVQVCLKAFYGVFAVSIKHVSLWNVVIRKKTSDGDEPANCYEPEWHGDVSFSDSDWWRCTV